MAISVRFKKLVDKKKDIYRYLKDLNEYKEAEVRTDEFFDRLEQKLNKKYWKDVIEEEFEAKNRHMYKNLIYSTRGDYLYNFTTHPDKTIALDIGTGWGQSLDALSRESKEVWALDGTMDKLRFVRHKLRQEKLNNVNLINASILDTPFNDESFDLLTMIGVLEWVPVSTPDQKPRKTQIEALKECYRIMKKGGELCIGIENSHGLKYILGEPDDHTGVTHITYLPRKKASEKLTAIRGEKYLTYTYTMKGYLKLLQKAGFKRKNIKFYYPIPNYKEFSFIVPIKNIKRLKYIYKNLHTNLEASSIDKKVIAEELRLIEDGLIDKLKNRVSSYFIKVRK